MTTIAQSRLYGAEEAKALDDAVAYELIDGQLQERGRGAESSWVEARIIRLLDEFAERSGLFWVFASSMALHLFPDKPRYFRRADACLVLRSRFASGRPPVEDLYFVPDFVAEVVSPNDMAYAVDAKRRDYMAAGIRMVWFVYPETRSLTMYRPGEATITLSEDEAIPGFDVLPGFDHTVRDLFPL